jgi:transposase-like protein
LQRKKRMSEQTQKKKRRRKQQMVLEQVQEEVAVQNAVEVTEALEELKQQGVKLEIQVCPKCKSPRVKRARSTGGDMWAHLGMIMPSYECPDCGWQERVVLKATNKPLTVREVELIREAIEIADKAH